MLVVHYAPFLSSHISVNESNMRFLTDPLVLDPDRRSVHHIYAAMLVQPQL